MFVKRTREIIHISDTFTGADGEPSGETEYYLLKSMWVMMLAEFEGSIKGIVEAYIDKIKRKDVHKIHVCLLLQHFYPNKEEKFSLEDILSVYKKDPNEITYAHFTRDRKPKNKHDTVEKLFNTIGIFFSPEEVAKLKALASITQTRDAIAHGDQGVAITKKEFKNRMSDLQDIYGLLHRKLMPMRTANNKSNRNSSSPSVPPTPPATGPAGR